MRCRKHCGFVFTLLFDILIHYELVTLSNAQTRIFLHAHSRTTSMASWTLIDQSWITVGTEVQVFDSIVDGCWSMKDVQPRCSSLSTAANLSRLSLARASWLERLSRWVDTRSAVYASVEADGSSSRTPIVVAALAPALP